MECLTLKKANCKNCYKCIRHCPVKAIRFSGNQAYIIQDECIMCGQCFVVCPQDAKQIVSEVGKVRVMLQSGAPVVASLAPSFIANYAGSGIEEMREALKKLGFYDAEETALGATMVKREYDRMVAEENRDIIISSCCPSVNLLIRRYYPALLGYLAPVMSPMQAHCADIKRRIPGAKTVFIGPCVAKKEEAQECGEVDAVLTFDELTEWLNQENITVQPASELKKGGRARLFPTAGGILRCMEKPNAGYTYMALLGLLVIVLFYRSAKEHHDTAFRWMWLTIVLSFGFYIPVVLWGDVIPVIGLLMIPKTCAYVWTVLIGYSAMKAEYKKAD